MKKRNNDMKRHCSGTKKIIWMKWRSLTFTKSVTRRTGRVLQPKKASRSPKSDEPKKASSDGKKIATKAGKKVKKTPQPKKAPKSPEYID